MEQAWRNRPVPGERTSPTPNFPDTSKPRLTVRMTARIQGFPDSWRLTGKKTAAYRQVGNALPPPVAEAVGRSLVKALLKEVPEASPGQQLSLQARMA